MYAVLRSNESFTHSLPVYCFGDKELCLLQISILWCVLYLENLAGNSHWLSFRINCLREQKLSLAQSASKKAVDSVSLHGKRVKVGTEWYLCWYIVPQSHPCVNTFPASPDYIRFPANQYNNDRTIIIIEEIFQSNTNIPILKSVVLERKGVQIRSFSRRTLGVLRQKNAPKKVDDTV